MQEADCGTTACAAVAMSCSLATASPPPPEQYPEQQRTSATVLLKHDRLKRHARAPNESTP
jgi:hypothetical protein